MIGFNELYANHVERRRIVAAPKVLLCLDPGLTTGLCVFKVEALVCMEHLPTDGPQVSLKALERVFAKWKPTAVVLEDYRVYGKFSSQHVGSSMPTLRLIGMIETVCNQHDVPYHKQMAGTVKQVMTDEKLHAWGFYNPSLKHARDAVRHGCYFILFPPKTMTSKVIQYEAKGHSVG